MSSGSGGAPRGGIDLGGTKIQTVVVDDDQVVLGEARHPTPTEGGPKDVASAMAAAMTEAAEQAGVRTDALAGVGVGSPGDVDGRRGTVTSARNLPDWEGEFALGAALEEALGTRARLGNDVQVATDAEFELGAGRPYRSLLGVFWGTGVGGGIVLDGTPWLGRGAAGEIGHVVVRIGGERCGCGRFGCMEAYAGRASMERRARERHKEGAKTHLFKIMEAYAGRASMERRARERHKEGAKTHLFKIMEERGRTRLMSGIWDRALKRDDPLAVELIDEAIEALGAGVASVQNVLDVEAIIMGGGLGVRLGEPYARRVADAMLPHLFDDQHPPAMHVAELGDLGGAIGAALLARPAPERAV